MTPSWGYIGNPGAHRRRYTGEPQPPDARDALAPGRPYAQVILGVGWQSSVVVRAFADLFEEVAPETPEEIDAILREASYDPDEVGARMKAVAERAIAESPLNWRNRAPQELAEARAQFEEFTSTLSRGRADIVLYIEQLLARLGPSVEQAYAHFRNFESLSDKDLASLLTELEYLSQQRGQGQEGEE